MRSLTRAQALVVLSLVAQPAQPGVRIPYDKYTLSNGLTVVLSPDHSTPTVTVDVIYHVGSRDETPGHTGFAHLFEHVMFTGSAHVPYGLHDKYTGGVGGMNNGATSPDWTEFFESVPSNYLEIQLWIESDRMGFLLDSLDAAMFTAQREIVQNERRQRIDNAPNSVPSARDNEVLDFHMYGAGHPYSRLPIGSMADLRAASVDDVKGFFRTYYVPNNATLIIAGDFDPARAKRWVAKYFGDIPRGAPVRRPAIAPARLAATQHLTLEDRVQVPRLTIQWPSVDAHSPDQPALDILSDVLGNSRTARMTKALVNERQSAAAVGVFQNPYEGTGQFQVIVTARPGHTLTELETEVDSVIERIKRDGPTEAEIERVKAGQEIGLLAGLESNRAKALQLGRDEVLFRNPGYTIEKRLRQARAVTVADVRRVANKYLGPGRIVLSTVPAGKPELASHAEASTLVTDPFADVVPVGKR